MACAGSTRAACLAHPLPDGTAVGPVPRPRRTAASLDAIHAGDGERWRTFAAPFVRALRRAARHDARRLPAARGLAAPGRRPRARAGILDFTRLLLMPRAGAGRGAVRRRRRARLAVRLGDALRRAAGRRRQRDRGAYLNLLGHGVGWPSPEGGAGRLADALVAHLRELGGEVRTGATVTRIAVERGRVVGVELPGGEPARRAAVVADVMPGALAALAGDALPAAYARALRRYRLGPATLKIDWALDGPIPWTAPQAREAGTVHVGGSAPEVLQTTAMSAGLPERPFMLLGQQSLADPTRAPAGKHTAWAYTHGPQAVDWEAQSERHVERMEAQVERFAPGFRDLILARHVLGPPTCSAATRTSSAATSVAAATRSTRSSSARCRRYRPTARRCGACTWAARRRSPAELCMAFPVARPRGSRSRTRV